MKQIPYEICIYSPARWIAFRDFSFDLTFHDEPYWEIHGSTTKRRKMSNKAHRIGAKITHRLSIVRVLLL